MVDARGFMFFARCSGILKIPTETHQLSSVLFRIQGLCSTPVQYWRWWPWEDERESHERPWSSADYGGKQTFWVCVGGNSSKNGWKIKIKLISFLYSYYLNSSIFPHSYSISYFILYLNYKAQEYKNLKNHNLLCSLDPPNQCRLF